uniref:Uncharacterized protein n=1 Tax=Arion vulgaris TaxID=1028688 RepID=A0A0B7B8L7_9EUPU
MPVLLKNENTTVYQAVDVEALVNEVRERLCLKSREKLCSQQRSAPYRLDRHSSDFQNTKHYSSPELCVYPCKRRLQNSCKCTKSISSNHRNNQTYENPRDLLAKLISEQSLIQEAVRRLQSQTTPVPRKFFSFVEDDSCDKFSNQDALYSGSEEDGLSTFV